MDKNNQLNPKVSIIIPIYNEEKYILRSLSSLNNQSCDYKLFEIIIVDNNSSDNTVKVINNFILNNPKLKIKIIKEKRQGIAFARKTGFEFATQSQYLATIDAETKVHHNFVKEIIDSLSKQQLDAITWSFILDWRTLAKVNKVTRETNNYILSQTKKTTLPVVLQGSAYALSNSIYQKVGGIQLNYQGPLRYADDILLSQRILFAGGKVKQSSQVVELSGRRLLTEPELYLTRESHWGEKPLSFKQTPTKLKNSITFNKEQLLIRHKKISLKLKILFLVDAILYLKRWPNNQPAKTLVTQIKKLLRIDNQILNTITNKNWKEMSELLYHQLSPKIDKTQ